MASFRKQSDKTFQLVAYIRYADGIQKKRYKTWKVPEGLTPKAAEKAAQKAADEFEESFKGGSVHDRIKYSEFAQKWFSEYADLHLAPKTIDGYQGLFPKCNAFFGTLYLDEITPETLMRFYSMLKATPCASKYYGKDAFLIVFKKSGLKKAALARQAQLNVHAIDSALKGKNINKDSAEKIAHALGEPMNKMFAARDSSKTISAQTIKHYHRFLSTVLSTAVEWEYIKDNPARWAKSPKLAKPNPKYLQPEEAIAWLQVLYEEAPAKYRVAFCIGLFAGTRKEETFALRWKHIDFEKCTMTIEQKTIYIPHKGMIIGETKNESSYRVLPLPLCLVQILQEYKAYKADELKALGHELTDDAYIFEELDGHVLQPESFTKWLHKFCAKHPQLKKVTPHGLRHTNASILINNGRPLSAVAGYLGHNNADTTAKVYTHLIQSRLAAAANTVDDILSPYRK